MALHICCCVILSEWDEQADMGCFIVLNDMRLAQQRHGNHLFIVIRTKNTIIELEITLSEIDSMIRHSFLKL